jgi:hypothetical protein
MTFLKENRLVLSLLLAANDSQMNFTQIQDRLRNEILRKIQRQTLSISLLARQTGLAPGHLSNFLRYRRHLSMNAMDRILNAQRWSVADLIPGLRTDPVQLEDAGGDTVPVISHAAALFEPVIRPSAVQCHLHIPPNALPSIHGHAPRTRFAWQRFVAVRVASGDTLPMEPVLWPDAIVLIDRHYTVLQPYRPRRPNLYAVRNGSRLTIRYVEYTPLHLILRPLKLAFPVELIEIDPGGSPSELLAGRVVLILNEM